MNELSDEISDQGLQRLILSRTRKRIALMSTAGDGLDAAKQHSRRLLLMAVGLGILLIVIWLLFEPLSGLLDLMADRQAFGERLRNLGLLGPLMFALLQLLQVIVAVIPGHLLMIISGYAYGFLFGLLLNLVTVLLSSQIAFLLARRTGQPVIERLVSENTLSRWTRIMQRNGLPFFLVSFMIPVFPADVLNFVAGLSPMTAGQFFAASLLGRLPGMVLMTLVGSNGADISLGTWIVVIGAVAIAAAAWHLDFKWFKERYLHSNPCQVCDELVEICCEEKEWRTC